MSFDLWVVSPSLRNGDAIFPFLPLTLSLPPFHYVVSLSLNV